MIQPPKQVIGEKPTGNHGTQSSIAEKKSSASIFCSSKKNNTNLSSYGHQRHYSCGSEDKWRADVLVLMLTKIRGVSECNNNNLTFYFIQQFCLILELIVLL